MKQNYLILAAVLVGTVLSTWLVVELIQWNKLQACVTAGHRHCAPRTILH